MQPSPRTERLIRVAVGRPYPPTGLTSARWRELPLEEVAIADLTTTQSHLDLDALVHGHTMPWSDDHPNVVAWSGALYLEDGHHRVARAILNGRETLPVRVWRRGRARRHR